MTWSLVGRFRLGQTGSSSIVRAKLRKEQAHMAEHEPDGPLKRPLILTVNTLAMLSLVTIFVAGAIPVVVFPSLSAGRPGAFFGAIVFVPMAAFFGVVVFRSVFSRNRWATDLATAIYFALAVMALFGVVANIAEAIVEDYNLDLTFFVIFAAVGLAVSGYCVFCAILSLRWGRKLNGHSRGHDL